MAPDSNVAGEVVRKTVLIVEDNASLRHALCKLFKRKADLDVCGVAKNGNEALEVAAQLHPDLVVLDLLMPEMNGLDTARALRGAAHRSPDLVQCHRRESFRASETDRNF